MKLKKAQLEMPRKTKKVSTAGFKLIRYQGQAVDISKYKKIVQSALKDRLRADLEFMLEILTEKMNIIFQTVKGLEPTVYTSKGSFKWKSELSDYEPNNSVQGVSVVNSLVSVKARMGATPTPKDAARGMNVWSLLSTGTRKKSTKPYARYFTRPIIEGRIFNVKRSGPIFSGGELRHAYSQYHGQYMWTTISKGKSLRQKRSLARSRHLNLKVIREVSRDPRIKELGITSVVYTTYKLTMRSKMYVIIFDLRRG